MNDYIVGSKPSLDHQDLLDYWFGQPPYEQRSWWFKSTPECDAELRERFGHLLQFAKNQELDTWRSAPQTALAFILVTDQLPRNIYRGTPEAFATDDIALATTHICIERGDIDILDVHQAAFALMPLQHSESLEDQRLGVAQFEALAERDESARGYAEYAKIHHDLIERFGRFPHRNEVLGRESTPEERKHLASGGRSFGQ